VCGVAMLEGAVVRGQALLQCFLFKEWYQLRVSYLGEVTIEAISQFLIVEGAMLSNYRCVGPFRM
jgi:hypothetical protein